MAGFAGLDKEVELEVDGVLPELLEDGAEKDREAEGAGLFPAVQPVSQRVAMKTTARFPAFQFLSHKLELRGRKHRPGKVTSTKGLVGLI